MPLASTPIATIVSPAPIPALATAIQEHAVVCTATFVPQHFLLIEEDDDVIPDNGGLRPPNSRVIDAGGEVPLVIDSEEGGFTLRETSVIHVGENIGVGSEAP